MHMNNKVIISIVLDKRRIKKNGKFPLRLRVFSPTLGNKQKLYSLPFEFYEEEYQNILNQKRPREEQREIKIKLQKIESEANNVANSLSVFSFESFERLLFKTSSTKQDVNYYYTTIIDRFKNKNSISTYKNYETSLKCLLRFHKKPNINFNDITVSWLEQFEKFCTEKENKSLTTVSIYLRTLRTVFNEAKADNVINEDVYPFGKRKYQIPTSNKVKKALQPDQLKLLFEGKTSTPEQEKAKAFWFFSYLCNGMNFKDILNLKFKDIEDEKVTFKRAKTSTTNRNAKDITLYLNDYTKKVIETFGNSNKSNNNYIFPVLNSSQTADEQYRLIKNFIRSVNQNFLKYAENCGINEKISSYWARHSFTTMAIRKGASMEFVAEAVGHSNIKTTMGYFAGFEDKTKKDFGSKLLDF